MYFSFTQNFTKPVLICLAFRGKIHVQIAEKSLKMFAENSIEKLTFQPFLALSLLKIELSERTSFFYNNFSHVGRSECSAGYSAEYIRNNSVSDVYGHFGYIQVQGNFLDPKMRQKTQTSSNIEAINF